MTATANGARTEAEERWRKTEAGRLDPDLNVASEVASRSGRITVNFHPDRIASSGLTVAAGLLAAGRYVSQWRTGISSGGRTAIAGGDRERFEEGLFGTAYIGADPEHVEFPIYGAWDLLGDPHGGSPRFGSCFAVLNDRVRHRSTMCVGDSHVGPADVGTFDAPWAVLAGLAEQADAGIVLNEPGTGTDLLRLLHEPALAPTPRRDLDHYVEVQVHGGVDLATDVDAIVVDPSFRGTDVAESLSELGRTFDVEIAWHDGSEIHVEDVPGGFRGPTMPEVARRVARPDGIVDARAIGVAAQAIPMTEMQPGGDPPESEAQQLKYLWHTLLAHGHDAVGGPDAADPRELGGA